MKHIQITAASGFSPSWMIIRVAQAIVLSSQTDKFTWATAFSHYLGLKNYRKPKIKFFFCIFSPSTSHPKFYYITHQCEIEKWKKFNFFQFFLFKTKFFFVKAKFYMKISSFEVHYVDVAEMI